MNIVKDFFEHKPVLFLVLLASFGTSFLEYFIARDSVGNLNAEALGSASVIFFFANLASLFVTCWSLVWLMHREAKKIIYLSISEVLFALVKGMMAMVLWALVFFAIAGAIVASQYPELNVLSKDGINLPAADQLIVVGIIGFFVAYSYAVLMTVFSGSLLRKQFKKVNMTEWPTLARWYLPFIGAYTAMTQPKVWLALVACGALKALGVWGFTAGLVPVAWAADAASLIVVFFGFFVAYRIYARAKIEPQLTAVLPQ